MPINRENVRKLLQAFDFRTLFIEEMGWSLIPNARTTPNVAEKCVCRGMIAVTN